MTFLRLSQHKQKRAQENAIPCAHQPFVYIFTLFLCMTYDCAQKIALFCAHRIASRKDALLARLHPFCGAQAMQQCTTYAVINQ